MGILTLLIRRGFVPAILALLVLHVVATTAYGDLVVAGLADLGSRLVGFIGVAFDSSIQGAPVE
ncbi:MAG: hypothetical protein F4X16_08910 [Caldilineaceae bacterium SB0661_bin_34]|nr:hypothetical protein [Caldilineaceae bacterium SB0661_bin_34]